MKVEVSKNFAEDMQLYMVARAVGTDPTEPNLSAVVQRMAVEARESEPYRLSEAAGALKLKRQLSFKELEMDFALHVYAAPKQEWVAAIFQTYIPLMAERLDSGEEF